MTQTAEYTADKAALATVLARRASSLLFGIITLLLLTLVSAIASPSHAQDFDWRRPLLSPTLVGTVQTCHLRRTGLVSELGDYDRAEIERLLHHPRPDLTHSIQIYCQGLGEGKSPHLYFGPRDSERTLALTRGERVRVRILYVSNRMAGVTVTVVTFPSAGA